MWQCEAGCAATSQSAEIGTTAASSTALSAGAAQSMGNYPYPSSYILNGAGMLPPYPVRVACASLGKEGLDTDASLLSGLAGSRRYEYLLYLHAHAQCR